MKKNKEIYVFLVIGILAILWIFLSGLTNNNGVNNVNQTAALTRILDSNVTEKSGDKDPLIKKTCENFVLGDPYTYKGFSVYPIHKKIQITAAFSSYGYDYKTLDEAVENGYIKIEEKKVNQVSEVTVRNSSKYYILLIAGEIIKGGKQTRTISEDVILPPNSKTLNLSVFCVEHGRWSNDYDKFGSGKSMVSPSIRKGINAKKSSQSEVWDGVAKENAKYKISSKTGSLQDLYDDKKIQANMEEYIKKLYNIPAGSVGMLVTYGKDIISLDYFYNHLIFEKSAKKLLKGSITVGLGQSSIPKGYVTLNKIKEFVRSLGASDVKTNNGLGVGEIKALDFEYGEGGGIVYNSKVIHLSAFSD